jgi:hypothetical protein
MVARVRPTAKPKNTERTAKTIVQTKIESIGARMPSEVKMRLKLSKPMLTRQPGGTVWPSALT